MYDKEKLEEKPVPEAGDKIKATVIQIDEGKLKDFIDEESLTKWQNATGEEPAIHIIVETEEGEVRKKTIQVPTDNKVHPSSNLGKWKTGFKDYPFVGQKIYLLADAQGFFQFPKF